MQDCLDALEASELKNQEGAEQFDPLVRSYLIHYQFEAIHPFKDGNGRVGRLLLALMTWRACELRLPWLYMSAYFERYRDEYIDLLFGVSARGDWESWIEFCLRGTVTQAEDAIRRCQLLNDLKDRMHARTTTGSGRLHTIIDGLFVRQFLTIPTIARELGVSYHTARADLQRLRSTGILRQRDNARRPAVFFAPEVLEIAYQELDEG